MIGQGDRESLLKHPNQNAYTFDMDKQNKVKRIIHLQYKIINFKKSAPTVILEVFFRLKCNFNLKSHAFSKEEGRKQGSIIVLI